MKKRNSINYSSTSVEMLHVNKYSSELVHRHIINPFTSITDDYQSSQYIIMQDIHVYTYMYVKTGKPSNLKFAWKLVFPLEV